MPARSGRTTGVVLLVVALAVLAGAVAVWTLAPAQEAARDQAYRPQIHYTPAQNWMNDPNGLVWHAGEYHLFYQYNPGGPQWDDISWGHAVSTDLVRWEELPVAIPATDEEQVFSGGAVVDHRNTSGFGTAEEPPMVAVYTSADRDSGIQAQSLAYSTDRGRTWTRYEGNPVLDIGSTEFRDPKVFWYDEGGYWVMTVVLATERKVQIYRSDDLRSWTHLSDFGPANAVGGVWEVPDLFELPVDGDPDDTAWVLVVNLNPGAVAGGSGAQYFVGDFDGERFTADTVVTGNEPPPGVVFEDFEDGYGDWTVHDAGPGAVPFGDRPASGTAPGQTEVHGHLGEGLVNSFAGGDEPRGRLVSPAFEITEDYVNLLVGGGAGPGTSVSLVVDGDVVRSASGDDSERLDWVAWDVHDHVGRSARIQVQDDRSDEWGHVLVDHVMFSDEPALPLIERYDWLDHGKDYYAAVSWNDAPGGERLLIAWMSNWQYAADVPTDPWRGAMTLPRQLSLRTVDGEVRLVQDPVRAVTALRDGDPYRLEDEPVADGVQPLPEAGDGAVLEIRAEIDVGSAEEVGLNVRVGGEQRTVVGYDVRAERLFVDRTRSGRDGFSPDFPGVHSAPLAAPGGRVRMTVYVDRSSVEVYGGDGQAVITDRIFPDLSSTGTELYARGGEARLVELSVHRLEAAW